MLDLLGNEMLCDVLAMILDCTALHNALYRIGNHEKEFASWLTRGRLLRCTAIGHCEWKTESSSRILLSNTIKCKDTRVKKRLWWIHIIQYNTIQCTFPRDKKRRLCCSGYYALEMIQRCARLLHNFSLTWIDNVIFTN